MRVSLLKNAPRWLGAFSLLRKWWLLVFILFCACLFEQSSKRLSRQKEELRAKLNALMQEYEEASTLQEDLRLRVNSQEDPDWIELTLIKNLGLVPEGQIKVVFQ